MNFRTYERSDLIRLGCVLFLACVLGASFTVLAQEKQPATSTPSQVAFNTPELAAAAFIAAADKFDVDSLKAMLGPKSDDLVSSGDEVQDKNKALDFARLAKEKTSVELSKDKKQATLVVGPNDWPLSIPIVKRGSKWYFDSNRGRAELLRRRIGGNELDAITICRGYVDAQKEYASELHDDSQVHQYAQRIISTPGKKDGLYWKNEDGTGGGPISEPIAKAIEEGYSVDKKTPTPYHGYYFKILKGRGPAAPEGEVDFVYKGMMIGGFALAAAPAEYGVSGIKSFIVSYEGIVYQKDLGTDSLKTLSQMEQYNPDKTWTETDDNWPNEDAASISKEQKKD